jgi:hypothetical protein
MSLLETTKDYYFCLVYFLRSDGDWSGCPYFEDAEQLQTKVHIYGLYLDLFLWGRPHYRAPTYRHDIKAVSSYAVVWPGRPWRPSGRRDF